MKICKRLKWNLSIQELLVIDDIITMAKAKYNTLILAQRLAYLAETSELLHNSQIGGRLKKSAIDAILLTNSV